MKNKKQILIILASVIATVFSVAIITQAVTTVGNNVSVGGDFTVSGNATTTGNQVISGNLNVHGAFSPDSFTFNPAGIFTVSGTTTLATTTAAYLTVSNNGIFNNKVGIGTSSISGWLHIGNMAGTNSVDPVININRSVDDGTVGNGHAFSDSSTITRSGSIGYNSYDARATLSGTSDYNHYAAFQAAPTYSSVGNMSTYYGFYSLPTISSGTVTTSFGVAVVDPVGAGAVVNNYGLYVGSLIKGSVRNYAIYTEGTTKSYFGGNVGIGITDPGYLLYLYGSNIREKIQDSGTGYALLNLTNDLGSLYVGQERSTGGALVSGSTAYSSVLGTGGAHSLHLFTNGAIRQTINSAGNVGVGTSTPAYNLEVSSSASTTVMIGSGALTGCLGIGDTDKAGITWCTALDGTLTCSGTKPQQCK